jgi:ectoine hydroxylase-related dioxygenase (phytanoyl-CoA dioxygenase family)
MSDSKDILTNKEGYKILPGFLPRTLLSDFNARLKDLYPVRASSSKKVYAEREDIKKLEDISVWWSQSVLDFDEVKKITKLIDPVIKDVNQNLDLYTSDVVFINPGSNWISAHVDTPHRFNKWNFDKRLLGIQCIITLADVPVEDGATGLVPFSQKRDFDINKCYSGQFDRWFIENCKQTHMTKGTLLFYNCRVLHSSMPNKSSKPRPALLINYLDRTIINEVSKVDNVWTSNGKGS